MIEIRWHGRGGQGAFTASKLFGEAVALYGGKHSLAFPSFGPERRGAPVLAFTKIAETQIQDRSEVRLCDYVVILDETLFNENYYKDLKPNGKIILNTEDASKYDQMDNLLTINATDIALKVLGKPIANTAMIGALAAVSGIANEDTIHHAVAHYFKGDILAKNKELISLAFAESIKTFKQ